MKPDLEILYYDDSGRKDLKLYYIDGVRTPEHLGLFAVLIRAHVVRDDPRVLVSPWVAAGDHVVQDKQPHQDLLRVCHVSQRLSMMLLSSADQEDIKSISPPLAA